MICSKCGGEMVPASGTPSNTVDVVKVTYQCTTCKEYETQFPKSGKSVRHTGRDDAL